MDINNAPSLLEPKSRGGESARCGFMFQDYFLVSQIPCWLQYDGFASVICEAVGDIEVKLYTPGRGLNIELIEVKDFNIGPSDFWNEIDRFYELDQGSPGTYRWFRLVAPAVSQTLAPLANGLRRLQSAYHFYPEESGIAVNSLHEFVDVVSKAKKRKEYAEFIFRRVLLDTGHQPNPDHGETLFRQNLGVCLPEYRSAHFEEVSSIYRALLNLTTSPNTPISRKEIEETMRLIPSGTLPPFSPVRLYTEHQGIDTEDRKELVVNWSKFFGGGSRVYPGVAEWNSEVLGQLTEIGHFIHEFRNTRQLRVLGSRRLSASPAIGHAFPATGGFTLEIEHRDRIWSTDDHANKDTEYTLGIELAQGVGEALLVSIGIPNDIKDSVSMYAQKAYMERFPLLSIFGREPVESAGQANSIAAQVKASIWRAVMQTGTSQIHLFCAIPSFLALLIGYRLNATPASVHCYEYTAHADYVPTCILEP